MPPTRKQIITKKETPCESRFSIEWYLGRKYLKENTIENFQKLRIGLVPIQTRLDIDQPCLAIFHENFHFFLTSLFFPSETKAKKLTALKVYTFSKINFSYKSFINGAKNMT